MLIIVTEALLRECRVFIYILTVTKTVAQLKPAHPIEVTPLGGGSMELSRILTQEIYITVVVKVINTLQWVNLTSNFQGRV